MMARGDGWLVFLQAIQVVNNIFLNVCIMVKKKNGKGRSKPTVRSDNKTLTKGMAKMKKEWAKEKRQMKAVLRKMKLRIK